MTAFRCTSRFKHELLDRLSTSQLLHRLVLYRSFGQPAAQTHPHLLRNGEVTPGVTQDEFRLRRHRLMEFINRQTAIKSQKPHLVVIPSAGKQFMTHDIPYPFRQNTDFLYLSGFLEPSSLLVLESHPHEELPSHKSTLFVPKRDVTKELWEGPRSGIDGAIELTGVDQAFNIDDFDKYINKFLSKNSSFTLWYDFRKPAHPEFHAKYITNLLRENKLSGVESIRTLVQALRVFKSPAEVELMQKSCLIASQAFKEVMKFSHAEIPEASLYAKMDFECRIRGAEFLAYPPVVAGGNRANTIHYVHNNQLVAGGDLVLMDAGCEYHGYASDITRTWPVSGSFKPGQRALYEALLEVQENCVRLAASHVSVELIFHEMLMMIGRQLQRLGIVSTRLRGQELVRVAREFCPHHVGHYLGMDVHDTDEVSRHIDLKPGMVITIEPGIYVPLDRTDVPSHFRGNGIRIEDDVLITTEGCCNLSGTCPKHPDEIEKAVQGTLTS